MQIIPGSVQLTNQLTVSPAGEKLLGAQVIGKDGVDQRIGNLSSVIQRGSIIYELTEFGNAYAPPYSSALADHFNLNIHHTKYIIMLDSLKKILGLSAGADYKELLQKGAVIIDVRSPEEFRSGHIKQSVNIPLGELSSQLSKIKKGKPVIFCCASGMRSASAKNMLQSAGFTQVYNGGGWMSLKSSI